MIHGGPGLGATSYRDQDIIEKMESKFAVVYWDQRSAGASQGGQNGDVNTLEDVVIDFEKVVILLKSRYGKNISIFVNGHSWGGYLTPAYLIKGNNQAQVKGWINTDGAHDNPLVDLFSKEMMLEKAKVEIAANRNVDKWTEIKTYCEGLLSNNFTFEESEKLNGYASRALAYTPEIKNGNFNIRKLLKDFNRSNVPITAAALSAYNKLVRDLTRAYFSSKAVADKLNTITIPTLIIFGKYDYVCPPKLADEVETKVKSTYKKKIILEQSGHNPMISEPDLYWNEVIAFMNKFK
jgi:pimeloyl-ACP methyl ester carboxylesterase